MPKASVYRLTEKLSEINTRLTQLKKSVPITSSASMFRLDLELLDPPPCVIAPDIIDPAELK